MMLNPCHQARNAQSEFPWFAQIDFHICIGVIAQQQVFLAFSVCICVSAAFKLLTSDENIEEIRVPLRYHSGSLADTCAHSNCVSATSDWSYYRWATTLKDMSAIEMDLYGIYISAASE